MTFEVYLSSWAHLLHCEEAPQIRTEIEASRWTLLSGAPIDWDVLERISPNLQEEEQRALHQYSYGFPYVGNARYLESALETLWIPHAGSYNTITYVPLEQRNGICADINLPRRYIAPSNHPYTALGCLTNKPYIQKIFAHYSWPDDIDTAEIDPIPGFNEEEQRYMTKEYWFVGMMAYLAEESERLQIPLQIDW